MIWMLHMCGTEYILILLFLSSYQQQIHKKSIEINTNLNTKNMISVRVHLNQNPRAIPIILHKNKSINAIERSCLLRIMEHIYQTIYLNPVG